MADDEIVVPIKLEGGETVAQQLAKIGEQGAAAFKPLNDALKDTSERLTSLSDSLQQVKVAGSEVAPGGGGGRGILGFLFGAGSGAAAEREIEGTTSAAHRLREGIQILRPALEEAGVGLGGFGALSAVARLGVGGLAAAVGGGVLVGLANLDDRAQKTRRGLGDLFQNPKTGNALYKDLDDQAKQFGTSAESFTAPLDSLVRGARQTGDSYPQVDLYTKALTSLYAAMRSGGASNEEATKGLADFSEGLAKAGKLTPDLLQSLEGLSQRGADALAQALGRINADQLINELKRGVTESARTVVDALANTQVQNKKTFDNSAKDVRTYRDSLSELGKDAARGIEGITGKGPDKLLQDFIDTGNRILKQDFSDIQRAKTAIEDAYNSLRRFDYLGGQRPPAPAAAGPTPAEIAGIVPETPGAAFGATPSIKEPPEFYSPATAKPAEGAPGTVYFDKEGNQKAVPLPGTEGPIKHGPGDHWFDAQGEHFIPEVATPPGYQERGPGTSYFDREGNQQFTPGINPPISTVPAGVPGGGLPGGGAGEVTAVAQRIETAFSDLAGSAPTASAGLQGIASSAPQANTALSDLAGTIQQAAESIAGAIADAFAGLSHATAPPEPAGGSAGGATGGLFTGLSFMRFAPGGPVGGVGTGKSDSNLALLSRGEFVHQEPAVRHYGTAFMHAINNMTFPKFSLGGLMDSISSSMTAGVPRLAAGGVASSGSANYLGHYTVDLRTDKGTVSGLRGGQDVVDQLSKSAVNRQMRTTFSGGGVPNWYGGRNS